MQISLNIIDILCLHIFLLDPFEFPYYFYRIRGEIDLGIVHSCMYP